MPEVPCVSSSIPSSGGTVDSHPARIWVLADAPEIPPELSKIHSSLQIDWTPISPRSLVRRASSQTACDIAIVDLRRVPQWAGDGSQAVERLNRTGYQVIAIHPDIAKWSIQKRCAPLLAGAQGVLDCAGPDFGNELDRVLAELIHEAQAAQKARNALIQEMRSLGMVGASERWLEVFGTVQRVSQLSDLPVLVCGETGCGKELLVRAIHRLDPKRRDGPWIPVNCGAISMELAESELFGHRRGAFTGADRERAGYFRSANEGVLFLDEVGELNARLQEKLLRVLQEGKVKPVGEDRDVEVDVRVIAATNRDLAAMVAQGVFREDLYHRLTVYTLQVPPLRERISDLRPLVLHFIQKHSRLSPTVQFAKDDFIEALSLTNLPGNARQVENLVRQAMIGHRRGNGLSLDDLPRTIWQDLAHTIVESPGNASPVPIPSVHQKTVHEHPSGQPFEAAPGSLAAQLGHYEKILVERALKQAGGNQSETARLLGITPRSVYNKLRKHCLTA